MVQEAYLRAWKGIGKFRGDAQFSTWMYRITANAARDPRRKRRRHRTEPLDASSSRPTTAPEAQPEAHGRVGRARSSVAAALDELPPKLRARRGAEGRLRAAPRGDRRGARHLGHGGEGAPAPGPRASCGTCCTRRRSRPVRCDEVADAAAQPGRRRWTTSSSRSHATSSRTCAARPSSPATAGCSAALAAAADPLRRADAGAARDDPGRLDRGGRAPGVPLDAHGAAHGLRRRDRGRAVAGRAPPPPSSSPAPAGAPLRPRQLTSPSPAAGPRGVA